MRRLYYLTPYNGITLIARREHTSFTHTIVNTLNPERLRHNLFTTSHIYVYYKICVSHKHETVLLIITKSDQISVKRL